MKRKLQRKHLIPLALLLLLLLGWILWGNTALMLSEISVESERLPGGFDGFRVAHVSDLHNAEFGEDNRRLLQMIADAEPDIIAITGDLVDSRRTDIEIALRFAEKALQIAPVYYVTGNHESRIEEYEDLKSGLEALGATVLEDESLLLEKEGESIRLIGLSDPAFNPSEDTAAMFETKLRDLTDGEAVFNILLSHRPELFQTYAAAGMDLALSGHAHGGQFRLPFVGGLIAPNQGLFPRYDAGLYREGSSNMVVSRGLGNSLFPFRVNNRPELVLVTLSAA